jgi:hypothetical protein
VCSNQASQLDWLTIARCCLRSTPKTPSHKPCGGQHCMVRTESCVHLKLFTALAAVCTCCQNTWAVSKQALSVLMVFCTTALTTKSISAGVRPVFRRTSSTHGKHVSANSCRAASIPRWSTRPPLCAIHGTTNLWSLRPVQQVNETKYSRPESQHHSQCSNLPSVALQ